MTWTYASNFTLTRDVVRLLIGDTNTNDQLLSDEEIAFYTDNNANAYFAASDAAKAIAAKYARKVSTTVGDLRKELQQQREAYLQIADQLRARGSVSSLVPYAGGISIDDKQTQQEDTDRVKPAFRRRTQDYPGTDTSDPDVYTRSA